MSTPLHTFIIYARADEEHKRQLLLHLRPLVGSNLIKVLHDGQIQPGEDWEKAIKAQLHTSELILLLVSANAMSSEFIQSEELQTALDRQQSGQARLIPILVSPYSWKHDPIVNKMQILPSYRADGPKAVTDGAWQNEHEAWATVVESLGDMIKTLNAQNVKVRPLSTNAYGKRPWKNMSTQIVIIQEKIKEYWLQNKKHLQPTRIYIGLGIAILSMTFIFIAVLDSQLFKSQEGKRLEALASIRINMVEVKGGSFIMGNTIKGTEGEKDECPHKVTVNNFFISKYELTQAQWTALMETNPSERKDCHNCPVENISWSDV